MTTSLSCFAWNKDGSKLAVCPSSSEIWIFKTNKQADTTKWERVQILKEVRAISKVPLAPEPGLFTRLASGDRAAPQRLHRPRRHRVGGVSRWQGLEAINGCDKGDKVEH